MIHWDLGIWHLPISYNINNKYSCQNAHIYTFQDSTMHYYNPEYLTKLNIIMNKILLPISELSIAIRFFMPDMPQGCHLIRAIKLLKRWHVHLSNIYSDKGHKCLKRKPNPFLETRSVRNFFFNKRIIHNLYYQFTLRK